MVLLRLLSHASSGRVYAGVTVFMKRVRVGAQFGPKLALCGCVQDEFVCAVQLGGELQGVQVGCFTFTRSLMDEG